MISCAATKQGKPRSFYRRRQYAVAVDVAAGIVGLRPFRLGTVVVERTRSGRPLPFDRSVNRPRLMELCSLGLGQPSRVNGG